MRCAVPFLPSLWGRTTGRMFRSDIAAKKNFTVFGSILGSTYALYPKAPHTRSLLIWVPKEDDYFRNWIAGIPSTDKQFFRDRRKSR